MATNVSQNNMTYMKHSTPYHESYTHPLEKNTMYCQAIFFFGMALSFRKALLKQSARCSPE